MSRVHVSRVNDDDGTGGKAIDSVTTGQYL